MIVTRFAAGFSRSFPDLLGGRVAVALSGGSDSVALLRLLVATREAVAVEPVAVHVHHHLRGAAADEDLAFCRALAASLAVPFVERHLDPRPPRGTSPEAWWRRERYRLLEAARAEARCQAVATAHTRDDQAETVLFKLLRGSGPRGLAGVRRRVGTVVRPLLDFRREALRQWLTSLGQGWREDESNVTARRPRSVIRGEVLPFLQRVAPRVVEHLAALAETLAADEEVLGALLAQRGAWPEIGRPVPLAAVASLPPALQRRWCLELAARLPLAEPPSREQLGQVAQLLATGVPAAVDLGRRWVLRRRGGALSLHPPPTAPFQPVPASLPGEVALPGGFVARLASTPSPVPCHRGLLSRRCFGASLAWRSLAPGERLAVAGRPRGAVLLARAGVPAEWRRGWPVLEADGTMIWVPAVGPAAGWEGGPGEVVAEVEEPWQRHDRSSLATGSPLG